MNENLAAGKADAILLKMIESQPGLTFTQIFSKEHLAKEAAVAIAAFRNTLVDELKKQEA